MSKEKEGVKTAPKKSSLDAILSQYEKNKSSGGSVTNQVDLTNYFSDKLAKGVNEDERTIRILPTQDKSSPFVEAYWHELQVDNQWKKIYCRDKNDGERCPLCEVEEALRLTGKEEEKKLAKTYRPRLFYIAKVIDRSKEEEGVKFYRFKKYFNGDGVMDKLFPIFKKRGDISDPKEGRDITFTLGRDQNKNSKVTSLVAEDPTMLTDDKEKAILWYKDTRTYKDVYKAQDVTYVEIIAKQQKPVWSKVENGWVAEDDFKASESSSLEDEIVLSKNELSSKSKPATKAAESKPTSKKVVKSMDDAVDEDEDEVTTNESTDDSGEEWPF